MPRVVALLLAIAIALPLPAADRQRIATINVGATSLFTFLGCLVQGKLQKRTLTRRDAGRCFAAGGVAGVGFYQAKRLVARGDITTGWLAANLATSVVENTTAGEHPLSRVGYTFGPLRLRVATPLDRARESYVDVDVSAAETIFLARAIGDADEMEVRNGMIWYDTREPIVEGDRVFHGYTWGIFPGVWRGADETTVRHEAVHAVQSLQLDSIEPPALTFHRLRRPVRTPHPRRRVESRRQHLQRASARLRRSLGGDRSIPIDRGPRAASVSVGVAESQSRKVSKMRLQFFRFSFETLRL